MALVAVLATAFGLANAPLASAASDPCVTGNAVACENSKPGSPPSEWDIVGAGDDALQGFATTISVQPGQTIKFKIKASASYTVDIYRLGYYGGLGARRQASTWTVSNPVVQGACAQDPSTQNYDCGTWAVSTQWAVPSTAVSGVYIAKLKSGSNDSHITFVVRDDASHSDVVFKTSDSTWQAYNLYGIDADFYRAPVSLTGSQPRAFKISYNRPFATRDSQEGRDFVFSNEYPTLRFLERNGIDVSYSTDIDVSTGSTVLTNHKAFMSVGHDEYWTMAERNNVEAARDSGVNLMFLSGNEAYWHTRLEPSIDGSGTANRTLVCYKDTWDQAKIDPGEGTPTWRDPQFPAPNGTRPENALSGTLYMSNNTDLAITVSAAQGKARVWRNTSLASLPNGGSATLAPHSIGYESDEDLDNGFRPAGLMRLSETTGPSPQEVQNPGGNQVAPGTTTHSLTLYRAASGALVFGAGTINWGWGLDQTHDGDTSNPADSRMQQATLNLLADMGVQATTLMAGLVAPTASTDTQAPTVTVSSPSAGATLGNGSLVTVSGTASDSGGVVTNIEVSMDNGASYHRATGTTSWTYSGVLSGVGASSIKVRASDDSANLSTPKSVAVTVTCPCSLFGATVPTTPTTSDPSQVELGVHFKAAADGFVSGIRFFKGTGNSGTHTGTLWTSSGMALASGTFTNETASGWQTLNFGTAVPVTAGVTYVASYYAPNGHYAGDNAFFAHDYTAVPLTAPGRPSAVTNGIYKLGSGFPTETYANTNYWVDVVYSQDDTTPPTVSTTSPIPGATSVATTVKPSATFAGSVNPATVSMTLKDAGNNPIVGTTTFDAASRTARFTPSAALSHSAAYTASVSASSAAGVPMPTPYVWSFTVSATDPLPGICPCSIWPDSATPAVSSENDASSVELGVKFTAEVDGTVNGVRFYKGPLNVGTHTGSLWTAAGVQLATVTFTGESSSGWQTAYFTSPVDVTADTTYVVSYHAPSGGYATTANGLATAVDAPPLHTLAGGGVYAYGSGAPLNASPTNYWVDLVFNATDAAPTVARTAPGSGATNTPVGSTVSATFAAQVQSGTAQLVVKNAANATVPGTTAYVSATRTITFTPTSALAAGAGYSATASGATALSGNQMSPYTWSFTTAGVNACPCTLFDSTATPGVADAGDGNAVELGVAFSSSTDGQVTGVRFYKSALNTGSHVGSLWSASGTLLATGTFTGESASGWQTLTFPGPVAVTAGTTYVASYFAPNGHYAATGHFFDSGWTNGPLTAAVGNGRYRYGSSSDFPTDSYGGSNYWIDAVFKTGTPPDTTPPSVTTVAPLGGATSQPASTTPAATFGEGIDTATLAFTVKTSGGASVPGSAAYDGPSRTATFTPTAALTRGTTYTASVTAADGAGNAMAAPKTWSFTVAKPDPTPGVCPCSLWTDATTPAVVSVVDNKAVELGTSFRADSDGFVSGVRFYKGPDNTGTHTISLWATDGSRLATANVTGESTTGWQTASFASPVAVTGGVTYVASYAAPVGMYSATAGGFDTQVDTPPLHGLADGGRYVYGSGYPSNTSSANYWVDPVFSAGTPPADITAPTISAVGTSGTGSARTVTWTTDESSTSVVSYGTSASSLTSTANGASGTSHSVSLTGLANGTTYYYRVMSADAAGNSSTSPVTSGSPASFAVADTVAPVVTSVAASGSGTTATVTWTTNESSTSSVAYGTSATSLTSSAAGASGTSHSVTLSGLAPNTRYYYRVTSADPAGNSTTSPATTSAAAQYAPPVTPVTATTVADFATGTGGYVADSAGGEVVATPATGFEFAGTTVPSGLTSTTLATGGTTSVANKVATLNGTQLAPTATSATGVSLSTSATVGASQTIAWAQTNGAASGARAAFVTSSTGALSAVINDSWLNNQTVAIAGTYTGAAHEYRIDWASNTATFFVDGVQKATNGFRPLVNLKPMLVDPAVTGTPLVVDWLRTGPYAASSTYVSGVVDAGATVGWDTLARDVVAPTGTTVTIQVRSGGTATPGTGWTAWTTVSATAGSITRSARYLQYQVISTTSGTRFVSPQTRSVQLAFHVL